MKTRKMLAIDTPITASKPKRGAVVDAVAVRSIRNERDGTTSSGATIGLSGNWRLARARAFTTASAFATRSDARAVLDLIERQICEPGLGIGAGHGTATHRRDPYRNPAWLAGTRPAAEPVEKAEAETQAPFPEPPHGRGNCLVIGSLDLSPTPCSSLPGESAA